MKMLLLVLLMVPTFVSGAEKLAPLAESVERIMAKDGQPDMSELAYVGIRCAALYTDVITYFEENARNDEDRKAVAPLKTKAVACYNVGVVLSQKTGKSDENIKKQMKMLIAYYAEEMTSGKQLNNNSMTSLIVSDLESANMVSPLFESLYEDTIKQQNKTGTMP